MSVTNQICLWETITAIGEEQDFLTVFFDSILLATSATGAQTCEKDFRGRESGVRGAPVVGSSEQQVLVCCSLVWMDYRNYPQITSATYQALRVWHSAVSGLIRR